MSTYVIGEIGACHDGRVDLMEHAIEVASHAGASAVKFQWTSNPREMAKRRGRADGDGYAAVYAKYLAWPSRWHERLAKFCERLNIQYMCTTYLAQDIRVVAPHVSRFKVASFEAFDKAFLLAHGEYKKPIHVSVGMAIDEEVQDLFGYIPRDTAIAPLDIRVMHCVSAYPAPVDALNMGVINGYSNVVPYDGFSDHSHPEFTWTGALAVAAGASTVEAHFQLGMTDDKNPDSPHAMNSHQFGAYVHHIRFAETCMGSGIKRFQPCEMPMSKYRVTA